MPPLMSRIFKILNKYFMVPLFRLGFGPVMCNPITGYIMVLKVVGRKTGKLRYAPVNYAIWKGNIYCVSGARENSDWFKNLQAQPEIEVILPGGAIFGQVELVTDPGERLRVIRQVLKNAGFAGFFEGYNPFKITDEELTRKTLDLPLLRIHPIGIGNGAADPKGWAGIWAVVFTIAVILLLILK
jgi:deazaflavin-dependent oxidoreductase (nitroreductase family)